MSKVGADHLFSKNGDERRIPGRIIGIAGPGVQAVANSGRGWSVAYVSTGKYRLTLDNPFNKFFGATAVVMSSTLGLCVQVLAYSTTNKTIDLQVMHISAGAFAAVDLGTTDEVWFDIAVGWSQRS